MVKSTLGNDPLNHAGQALDPRRPAQRRDRTSTEIVAAIDYFVRDPAGAPYRFASGHTLDVAGILTAEMPGETLTSRTVLQEKTFRTKVAAAIMAAHPVMP